MLRRITRILLIVVGVCVLLVGMLIGLAVIYEDDVKKAIVGQVNEYLNTPVSFSRMELTLVRRFPSASLRLSDVLAHEVVPGKADPDTLLYARELYLEFGLMDLFRGKYTVHEIHGEGVRAYPALDAQGRDNWHVWKSDSTNNTARQEITLDKVGFDELTVRYRDGRKDLEVLTMSQRMSVRGDFADKGSTIKLNGDAWLRHWWSEKAVMLSDRKAELKLNLAFGGADSAFHITKGEVLLGETALNMTLDVNPSEKGGDMDLAANGFGMRLGELVELLPEKMRGRLKRYGMDGDADVALHYAGPLSGEGPALSLGLKLRNGRLKEQHSGATFTAVNGELALDLTAGGTPRKLVVKSFNAKAASGSISGSCTLNGLTNAPIKADIKADIALADLLRFAQVDTLEQVMGRLKADTHVDGKLRDVADIKPADLRSLHIKGSAQLVDATLKMKGMRHQVSQLNTSLALDGNDATVSKLTCTIQGNEIALHGTLHNLMPYLLFADQRLSIEAGFNAPLIDLATLLHDDNAPASSKKGYGLRLPASINVELDAEVGALLFERFKAEHISCHVRLNDRVLSISPLTFSTADGEVVATLGLDGRNTDSYPLTITAGISSMNVSDLFAEFKDFGQHFVTHDQLKGTAHAQVKLQAPLSPGMEMDMDRLVCAIDLGIEDGRLIRHIPLMQVADYLRSNTLLSPFVDTDELRKRLSDVRFAKLENQILIKDRTVFVPQMTVNSSAMDIEMSGQQSFDGRIDHHINFRLGDLFKLGNNTDAFGPVVDDGTGMRIFLHMYGTVQDPQFKNDGAMAAQRRKEQIKQETANLKGMLHGIWKGEPPKTTTNRPEPHFTIEDAGPDTTVQQPKKRGLGDWLKNDDEEEDDSFHVEP